MNDFAPFALIATAAALWSQIKGIFERIRALFITRATLNGAVAEAVLDLIHREGRVLDWGDRLISSSSSWVRPLDRVAEVAYEQASMQPRIAWLRGKPLMFQCPGDHRGGNLPESYNIIVITSIRGLIDIIALTRDALDASQSRQSAGRRYYVRQIQGKRHSHSHNGNEMVSGRPPGDEGLRPTMKFLHWNSVDIGAPQPLQPFAAYSLSPEAAEAKADFEKWLKLKAWYKERGIPWRRGHLLHGLPGTGKTALVRALAQQADMPVFAFDLSTLSNEEFIREWMDMQERTPCIALIEDVDGVFHGRENILGEKGGGLTFDCLLNGLGGIQTADGVFVFVTTNKIEHLDEALGQPLENHRTTRPGRLDRAYCLPPPTADVRASIIVRICGSLEGLNLSETHDMTAAQVTEWAITKALQDTWKEDV